jgi:putative thiamine transport system permease protein
VALVVAWFEATPDSWDARLMPLVLAPLVLPATAAAGRPVPRCAGPAARRQLVGLAWVHLLMVLPYAFTALAAGLAQLRPRYEVGAERWAAAALAFWWRSRGRMLAAPMASALAVGFAVSVAQYLSTQFIGAGRHATLTTEAVTLASGGQRTLAAAFGLLQALLPALAFAVAAAVSRRRA